MDNSTKELEKRVEELGEELEGTDLKEGKRGGRGIVKANRD